MTKNTLVSRLSALLLGGLLLVPDSLSACAVCFGKSDSAMAKGMNVGIFSLLVMVGLVLGVVASFFVFLARRSASVASVTAEAGQVSRAGSTESMSGDGEGSPRVG